MCVECRALYDRSKEVTKVNMYSSQACSNKTTKHDRRDVHSFSKSHHGRETRNITRMDNPDLSRSFLTRRNYFIVYRFLSNQ